jgi:Ala-tRNA(Pro) deacylase
MSIRDFLESRQIGFETLLHCPASTSTRRARNIHAPGRCLAKGVLIWAAGQYVLVVLPATHRVDLPRLALVLGVPEGQVQVATEEEASRIFDDCERGALPPFGRLYGLRTIVDVSLGGTAEFVFVANLRHEGMRMRYSDYEAIEAPIRARIASTTTPRRPRDSHRRRAG